MENRKVSNKGNNTIKATLGTSEKDEALRGTYDEKEAAGDDTSDNVFSPAEWFGHYIQHMMCLHYKAAQHGPQVQCSPQFNQFHQYRPDLIDYGSLDPQDIAVSDQLMFDNQRSQDAPRGTSEAKPAAPTPPQRHSPTPNKARRPPGSQQQGFNEARNGAAMDIGPGGTHIEGAAENLEAPLPMARGNPPDMLKLPLDDDEAMMEPETALSLQYQEESGTLQ